MSEGLENKVEMNDDHRTTTFAYLSMLRSLKLDNEKLQSVEMAMELLCNIFDVDIAAAGGKYDKNIDIVAAVNKASNSSTAEDNEKFTAFLDLLKKKGYLNGVEEGSEEYKQRMEKAKEKFAARNNPYQGMTAEQLKVKGNELMQDNKIKEALGYYTKAIELDSNNHLYFANRAAAHLKLQDYHSAVVDSERAIIINEKYAKAYVRLGTASYYLNNFTRAQEAYNKALELEPENEQYKEYLQQTKDKLAAEGAKGAGGALGMPGMGGMPGMPDMSQMMSMMQNPEFMKMATSMMSNPEFSGLVQGMAKNMGMAGADMGQMNDFMKQMQETGGRPLPDADGNIRSPFGLVNQKRMEELREQEMAKNPKFKQVMEAVKENGPAAMQQYMGDPEVVEMMTKFQNLIMQDAKKTQEAEDADG